MRQETTTIRQARIIVRSELSPIFYSDLTSPKDVDHRMIARALRNIEFFLNNVSSPNRINITVSSVSPVGEADDAKDWAVIEVKGSTSRSRSYTAWPSQEWDEKVLALADEISEIIISKTADIFMDVEIGNRNIQLTEYRQQA